MRIPQPGRSLTWLGLARGLVALLALVIPGLTLVSAFSVQEYALANLDNTDLHTSNAAWTPGETQARSKSWAGRPPRSPGWDLAGGCSAWRWFTRCCS